MCLPAIDSKIIATIHVLLDDDVDFYNIYTKIQKIMHNNGIHNITIQPELCSKYDDINCNIDNSNKIGAVVVV